jgi:hypothetical protein
MGKVNSDWNKELKIKSNLVILVLRARSEIIGSADNIEPE